MKEKSTLKTTKRLLLFFIIALALSGLTAIPVDVELGLLLQYIPAQTPVGGWLQHVLHHYQAVKQTAPFLLYGYDWLAFAHFVLALLFVGAYKDPVRNKWVLQFGLYACCLIVPFAFLMGAVRGIPLGWRLIDCSFGVGGFAVLWPCYRTVMQLEKKQHQLFQNPMPVAGNNVAHLVPHI